MRPLPGDDAWSGRQRSACHDAVPLMTSGSNNRMSFIVADEATVDSYLEQPSVSRSRDARKAPESSNILSLRSHDKNSSRQYERDHGRPNSPISRASFMTHSPVSIPSHHNTSLSRPVTPIMLGTSCAGSVLSSPSSGDSLAGSISEHAISSDDEEQTFQNTPSNMIDSGSAPQLVMPSIKMPSRRPFTDKGKSMGRLKVLIAGNSGIGKTSLIKAIVQTCEHIVHIDTITPQTGSVRRSSQAGDWGTVPVTGLSSTVNISEIYASTKSYPEWWAELGQSHQTQRRKSLGSSILERNICFVDTPGYRTGSSAMETIIPCVEYVEAHLNRVSSDSLSESDMLSMLGGNGGVQVDVIFYLINRILKPADIEYIRRLAPLTNIVPMLAKADTLSREEITGCKQQINDQLLSVGVRPFCFTQAFDEVPSSSMPTLPYAVSSATGSDHDVMDASLLMSPDYVQPLISSDLGPLVELVFSPNGSSWLRHSAAKKYLQWRNESVRSRPKHLYEPLSQRKADVSALVARTANMLSGPPTSLALTCVNHQQQQYDGQAQFHIVDWASDLQRSLASERVGYEAITHRGRTVRLAQELNDLTHQETGTLVSVPVKGLKEDSANGKRRGLKCRSSRKTMPHQDPLGLLQVSADLKAKGWTALEYLSGISILGGIAYWLARQRWQVNLLGLDL